MTRFRQIWLMMSLLLFFTVARAEQDLPIVIVEGNITYQSQLNYLKAFDSHTKKIIWETIVYEDIEPGIYIPGLEKDVQWIVIKDIKINGLFIKAVDSRDRVYFVNKVTGKISSSNE